MMQAPTMPSPAELSIASHYPPQWMLPPPSWETRRTRLARPARRCWHRLRESPEDTGWRRDIAFEFQQWPLRWAAAGMSDNPPRWIDGADYSDSEGTAFRRLLFVLGAGNQFSDVAGGSDRLATSLGREMVTIEPGTNGGPRAEQRRPHLLTFFVSHELRSFEVNPHLSAEGLHPDVREFTVRHAVMRAFSECQWAPPMYLGWSAHPSTQSAVHATDWRLTGKESVAHIRSRRAELRALLDCETCEVDGNHRHLRLKFGNPS